MSSKWLIGVGVVCGLMLAGCNTNNNSENAETGNGETLSNEANANNEATSKDSASANGTIIIDGH